ncbi:Six-hairpin glycosidase-like protein [Lyophyllum atratum]|nr:Six-hairpin glycosidase-like protein [Lyophyllum atratum]
MVNAKNLLVRAVSGQLLSFPAFPFSPGFNIQKVATLAESIPSHSWEFGAASQALLELYNSSLSVFGNTPFPVPSTNKDDVTALKYAASKIVFGEGTDSLSAGDGAVGDPASLGVSAVMLGKTDPQYANAAKATADSMISSAPRFWNGAISHRVSVAELWADFVYMAPPFLAYYAADSSNETLLHESVKQCGYYRQVLQSNTTTSYKGVWEHIIGPQSQDTGLWSTGNGWAAAGMTRVLATVMKAPVAEGTAWRQGAIDDLTHWILEILDGVIGSSLDGGLVRNYINDANSTGHGFGEISGSSVLASVAYRMAVLQPHACGEKYVKWADGIRRVLGGNDASGQPHITEDGVATPAVNPLGWQDTKPFTTGSPEGQVFVVLMYTAWRDCVLVGRCARNRGASRRMHEQRSPRDLDAGHH